MLLDEGLMLKYKTDTIKSLDDALEAWEELILNTGFGIWMVEKDKREAFWYQIGAIGGEVLIGIGKKIFGAKTPSKKKNKKI